MVVIVGVYCRLVVIVHCLTPCPSVGSSATLSRISRHRRSHTQERPHACTMCGYRYADLRRLREHMQAVHEPVGGDGEGSSFFQCKFCVRVFARRDNMQQHVRKIHSSKARLDSF